MDGQAERTAWSSWERPISGMIADFWSIERIVVGSTLVLLGVVSLPVWFVLGVVSLPVWFVFPVNADDPHPMP